MVITLFTEMHYETIQQFNMDTRQFRALMSFLPEIASDSCSISNVNVKCKILSVKRAIVICNRCACNLQHFSRETKKYFLKLPFRACPFKIPTLPLPTLCYKYLPGAHNLEHSTALYSVTEFSPTDLFLD